MAFSEAEKDMFSEMDSLVESNEKQQKEPESQEKTDDFAINKIKEIFEKINNISSNEKVINKFGNNKDKISEFSRNFVLR
jgi:hypothetical protein